MVCTDRGSNYQCGVVTFTKSDIRSDGTMMCLGLTKCLDKNAVLKCRVSKE